MHDLGEYATTTLIEVKVALDLLAPIPSGPWLRGALAIALRGLRRARTILDAIAPDDADLRTALDAIDARIAASVASCTTCTPIAPALRLAVAELDACLDAALTYANVSAAAC